jgi:hypothetical protein
MQKREGFRASLIGYHARPAKVKNVSTGISEREALSNLIRFSRSRDPSMKYDSLSTLMSSVDSFRRVLSCPGKAKLLEWFLPFLATVASSDAEHRRLAKDGGEVRMQTVYAYYTPNKSRRSPARGKLLALTPAIDRLLEDKLRRLNREAEPPKL